MGGTIGFIAIAVFMWFVLYHRQPERQSRHRATAKLWLTTSLKVCEFIVVGIVGLAVILAVIGLGFWGLSDALSAFSTVHGCLVMVFVVLVMLLFKD